uniref:NR LBD domain-containing protein n=1 Tax=Caenorhabditis tropicalis TaxID=1561998 RepID=A0A1I7U7F6_9PELO
MLDEILFDVEEQEDDETLEVDKHKAKEVADQRMTLFSNHSINVSRENRYRFPSSQFGYTVSTTPTFVLHDFRQILNTYMRLEAYCDAVDDFSGPLPDYDFGKSEPDLFQAVFYPRSIAPRTPMKPLASIQMTEQTLSSMWFRLVAHYFEWLAGISELLFLNSADKLRLTVCQLCKVICFSVVYANYAMKNEEDQDLLLFGSGYYWDPARGNDPLMDDYCQELKRVVDQVIVPVRKVRMTKEEFVIVKLIVLFDCTNLIGISQEGLMFSRSTCNKYREVLARYVRSTFEEKAVAEGWNDETVVRLSIERINSLLDLPMGVEKLGQVDDDILAALVERNYGGMRGILQQQIHTESKKIRNK